MKLLQLLVLASAAALALAARARSSTTLRSGLLTAEIGGSAQGLLSLADAGSGASYTFAGDGFSIELADGEVVLTERSMTHKATTSACALASALAPAQLYVRGCR